MEFRIFWLLGLRRGDDEREILIPLIPEFISKIHLEIGNRHDSSAWIDRGLR